MWNFHLNFFYSTSTDISLLTVDMETIVQKCMSSQEQRGIAVMWNEWTTHFPRRWRCSIDGRNALPYNTSFSTMTTSTTTFSYMLTAQLELRRWCHKSSKNKERNDDIWDDFSEISLERKAIFDWMNKFCSDDDSLHMLKLWSYEDWRQRRRVEWEMYASRFDDGVRTSSSWNFQEFLENFQVGE